MTTTQLLIEVTPSLDRFLGLLGKRQPDLYDTCEACRTSKTVAWATLKQLHGCSNIADRPLLHQLCQGSAVLLHPPKPRVRSKALQERLSKLQSDLDDKKYAEMVSDITAKEREAQEMRNSILPTFRLQASFGIHVIVTMGTFFAIGWYAGKVSFKSDAWAGLGGALGLTFGMLLETLLLIIRSNRPAPLEERMPHLTDPQRWRRPARGGSSRPKQE